MTWKKKSEQPRFFIHRKSIRKKSKWHRAFAHWSFIRESTSRRWCFFVHRICVEQSMPKRYELNMSKWHRFFAHQNYVEENTPKQRQIFSHWNHIRKVCKMTFKFVDVFFTFWFIKDNEAKVDSTWRVHWDNIKRCCCCRKIKLWFTLHWKEKKKGSQCWVRFEKLSLFCIGHGKKRLWLAKPLVWTQWIFRWKRNISIYWKKQQVWLRLSCCWWFGVMWKRMHSRENVTYISNTKHLVFFIKHYDDTRGPVKTVFIDPANFLKFPIANSLDSETIQNCSVNIISKLCLGLKIFKPFLSDGSSMITGVVSGVATRLGENELKSQISIHWIYHQLTMLCVNGSTKLILLEVFKTTVIQVRVFLKKLRPVSKGPFSGLKQFLIIKALQKW